MHELKVHACICRTGRWFDASVSLGFMHAFAEQAGGLMQAWVQASCMQLQNRQVV